MKTLCSAVTGLGFALAVALGRMAAGASSPVESLRVDAIAPACFDYLLAGVSTGPDGQAVLAFNDRAGRTYFRRVGEALGPYRVTAYEPRIEQVFNASINAAQEKKTGRATLKGAGGGLLTLEQGQPLPWPGYMARLVALDSGLGWAVREGDTFLAGETAVQVTTISTAAVCVLLGRAAATVPDLSDPERAMLQQRWAENLRRREEARRELADAQARAQAAEPAPRVRPREPAEEVPVHPSPPRSMDVGTEFRYPTEFQVIPALWDSSGRLISPTVVVPLRFETWTTGVRVRSP